MKFDKIVIKNYKCFNDLGCEIENIKSVNVIIGKNNAGKTSLLEAIYLGLTGTLTAIKKMRSNESDDSETYLHYNGQVDTPYSVSIHDTTNFSYNVGFKSSSHVPLLDGNFVQHLNFLKTNKISFLLANHNQFPISYNLSHQFNEADRRGESDEILNSIKLIDNSIDELKTYSDRSDIFLRRKGEKHRLPLPYFGDALQKMMRYAITAATLHSENGSKEIKKYLLIDEIENGLHYTVHDEFWEMLFKLAMAYDIQIFAATHSREMIEAFNRISQKDDFKGEAAYFELFKHVKTGEIAGHIIEADVLDYKLRNNKSLRGE